MDIKVVTVHASNHTHTCTHYTVTNHACSPHVYVIAQPMYIMSVAQDFM